MHYPTEVLSQTLRQFLRLKRHATCGELLGYSATAPLLLPAGPITPDVGASLGIIVWQRKAKYRSAKWMHHTESYKLWRLVQVLLYANGNCKQKEHKQKIEITIETSNNTHICIYYLIIHIHISTHFKLQHFFGNVSIFPTSTSPTGDRGTRPFLGEACMLATSAIGGSGNMGKMGIDNVGKLAKNYPMRGVSPFIARWLLVRGCCGKLWITQLDIGKPNSLGNFRFEWETFWKP